MIARNKIPVHEGWKFTSGINDIHCVADELRTTPIRKLTKARLVELGEMLENACKRIEDAGKTE